MATKIQAQGVIEVLSRNGKSFKIGDTWFSVFNISQRSDAEVGDEVSFEYVEKDSGGRTFYNIQGDVVIKVKGSGAPAPSAGPMSLPATKAAAPQLGQVLLARERCIVRQNAANVAAQLLRDTVTQGCDLDALAQAHRKLAEAIEDYTSGDRDIRLAAAGDDADNAEAAMEGSAFDELEQTAA